MKKLYLAKEQFNFAAIGIQIVAAGVGLPLIVMFNSVINADPELLPQRYFITSPVIMMFGASLIYLGTKRVKLNKRARITVI